MNIPSDPVTSLGNLATIGVADYFDRHPEDTASVLVAKAPDVLVLAHCIGAPKTAAYFAERLQCHVSERMIKTVKTKVATGIIHVTKEELETAARSHPVTEARLAREPSLCDPQRYQVSIRSDQEDPEAGGKPKKAAKKANAKRKEKQAAAKEMPAGDVQADASTSPETRSASTPSRGSQSKEEAHAPKRSPEQQAALERMKRLIPE